MLESYLHINPGGLWGMLGPLWTWFAGVPGTSVLGRGAEVIGKYGLGLSDAPPGITLYMIVLSHNRSGIIYGFKMKMPATDDPCFSISLEPLPPFIQKLFYPGGSHCGVVPSLKPQRRTQT